MKTFIIAALTADGFIAQRSDQPATWTSRADKKFFVEKTKTAGVVIMGRRTYETIGRPLPGRLNVVYTTRPLPPPPKREAVADLLATQASPAELLKRLAAQGYKQAAIIGGTSIYTLFWQAGLVDELYLTIEPKVFGRGLNLLGEALTAELVLREVIKLDEQVVCLNYQINH